MHIYILQVHLYIHKNIIHIPILQVYIGFRDDIL